jgi:hypothetical protein
VISHIRILHVKCKIIGKVKMETTAMWGITLIILKDIKCFQIWAYFEGIGINFNFENFQNCYRAPKGSVVNFTNFIELI